MSSKTLLRIAFLSLIGVGVLTMPLTAEPGDGSVCVGRTVTPPVVDGSLADACWTRTLAITPFVLQRQSAFAREQTTVRMTYDDTNLYVAFRCEQRCLNPVNNQLGAYKAEAREHDSDRIFKDDCVLVLLDTNSDGDSFYD
ncbi:MAG: hypothetical protein HON70_26010, partial [Lentisphaerae bacterium]|nr:hypothetical protein [Lentisphaerota bacterium]